MTLTRSGLLLSVTLFAAGCARAQDAESDAPIAINAQVIENFRIGSDETRFGAFEFRGGLEFSSEGGVVGGMSAIRFDGSADAFIGVMDTGNWYSSRILRDESGRMRGLTDFRMAPILSDAGVPHERKSQADAEGLALDGDRLIVGFEHNHRVEIFDRSSFPPGAPSGVLSMVMPRAELRRNAGIETVMVAPEDGPLDGAPVLVSERSLNADGDIYAAVLSGPQEGVFFVKRHPPFDVTDGAFLPDGDILLLERRFSLSEGIGMRIRRIAAADIRPGAVVDGDVMLEANFGDQIDNMEGLDVIEHADGRISVILVSDDNHLFLQRNLLLEFELVE
ncbi:hypothetical protein D5400_21055 [Georhizobium profundi]|uniref:Phytase-like domain-containing protein n=1 Tax=Georhizobium profundi TaxID=2341112 RepID=A0A3S9B9C1_9HYPH|nr:esterase-like activity of phytase family protein [Georhizobium profundi]AZN73444.1 hypothetical protein D5400_21055 [Georhizobium profundi]